LGGLLVIIAACAPKNEDAPTGGEELRREYVDALANVNQAASDSPLPPGASLCLGEAWVDVVGVETLVAKVTPEEIRADPGGFARAAGIDVTEEQGLAIARAALDCSPDLATVAGEAFVNGLSPGELGFEIDIECLRTVDHELMVRFFGGFLAADDPDGPMPEDAVIALLDWVDTCIDMVDALLHAIDAQSELDDEARACLEEHVTEEGARDLFLVWIMQADGGDEAEARTVMEMMRVMQPCLSLIEEQFGD
jgi:hypothetical protein